MDLKDIQQIHPALSLATMVVLALAVTASGSRRGHSDE